jgi:membrane fusion protein (multidrug efflux system)
MHRIMRPNRLVSIRKALWLVAAVAASVPAGCPQPVTPVAPPPPTVGVVESRRQSMPILSSPNATTRSLEQVTIRARVRGFLTERHFEEGSFVKKGDLLLVIDEESYKIALDSARAKLDEAEANLTKAEKSKGRETRAAQLALDEAQLSLARIEERRNRALVARNAGSREDLDKTEADRKKFEAQVDADRASLEQAEADYGVGVLSAKAQVEAARAAVRDARLNLGYCRMYAPIDGRIGEAKVKVGNLVGPDAGGGGGSYSELVTIHQLDPMGVEIRASSRFLEKATKLIGEGLAVQVTRPGLEGERVHPYEGQCYFIDNAIDETSSTFLIKARVPNPGGTLLPGEYVRLRMVVERLEDAVVVPETGVIETENGPVVYVVDKEGKVAIQRVGAAQSVEGLRIITSGLEAGVPVIVQGLQLIRPGIPVKAEPAILPKSDAAGAAEITAVTGPAAAKG